MDIFDSQQNSEKMLWVREKSADKLPGIAVNGTRDTGHCEAGVFPVCKGACSCDRERRIFTESAAVLKRNPGCEERISGHGEILLCVY